MPKLSDTQLVILSAAAKRRDGAVLPLPRSLKVNKAAATTVLKSLLTKGLVTDLAAQEGVTDAYVCRLSVPKNHPRAEGEVSGRTGAISA